jgi:hypothetical protein
MTEFFVQVEAVCRVFQIKSARCASNGFGTDFAKINVISFGKKD